MRVVIDTNVLVAAARSRKGAAFKLVSLLPSEKFETAVSMQLYYEYTEVLLRPENMSQGETAEAILDFLRNFLAFSHKQTIYYRWRPLLNDPDDDFVLELAVASESSYIVTFNTKDFRNIGVFGVETITPREFLRLIGEI
jgi:putative PIN family toxin of toxin-antitoxin system